VGRKGVFMQLATSLLPMNFIKRKFIWIILFEIVAFLKSDCDCFVTFSGCYIASYGLLKVCSMVYRTPSPRC